MPFQPGDAGCGSSRTVIAHLINVSECDNRAARRRYRHWILLAGEQYLGKEAVVVPADPCGGVERMCAAGIDQGGVERPPMCTDSDPFAFHLEQTHRTVCSSTKQLCDALQGIMTLAGNCVETAACVPSAARSAFPGLLCARFFRRPAGLLSIGK